MGTGIASSTPVASLIALERGVPTRVEFPPADHAHLMAGVTPIIALDMYEHPYHMDDGANAEVYAEAIMRNVDWKKANARYARAAK